MPDWREFKLLNDLIMTGGRLALAGLRERFPEASPDELRRRLATVLLGPELTTKVYAPEPDSPTVSKLPADFLQTIEAVVNTTVLRRKLQEFAAEQSPRQAAR